MSQELNTEVVDGQQAVVEPTVEPTVDATPTPKETGVVAGAVYKNFATEEDFEKTLKSERSKAQAAMLKDLGITSIDQGKEYLTKATTFEKELDGVRSELQQTKEFLALQELGVRDEYKQEALTLAKSQGGDLKDALKSVIAKLPIMSVKAGELAVGTQKTADVEEGTVKKHIGERYP